MRVCIAARWSPSPCVDAQFHDDCGRQSGRCCDSFVRAFYSIECINDATRVVVACLPLGQRVCRVCVRLHSASGHGMADVTTLHKTRWSNDVAGFSGALTCETLCGGFYFERTSKIKTIYPFCAGSRMARTRTLRPRHCTERPLPRRRLARWTHENTSG